MKKYQLKFNNGTELEIVKESNILYDILKFIKYDGRYYILSDLSVWMDGKVLD